MVSHSKKLLGSLQGEKYVSPPLWLMRQAGRYLPEYRAIRQKMPNFLTFCYTPEMAAEVTLQPIRRFGFDAAILFSDILVIPDALGMNVSFHEGEGPRLEAFAHEDDLKKLSVERVIGHLSPVFETIKQVKRQLPSHVTLIGFAGSPWTVATYMVEGKTSKQFEKVRQMAYAQPELFKKLMDSIVQATVLYLSEQVKAGAEVVQLFDSWSGVLPEDEFQRWVIDPTRTIVSALKTHYPSVPIIGFPKGAGLNTLRYIKDTGVDAVGVDYTLPLSFAVELQTRLPVQGNLDPVLLASDAGRMRQQTQKILGALGKSPFIFNLGHGILPHTPVANVELLVETVRGWKG